MKKIWSALAFFVMFTGPVFALGAAAFALSGIGGMYDKYDGTWIETALRWSLPVAAIYWGSATAIYLAISFITNAWDKTWIVWPVAGVAYGVVLAVMRVLKKNR